MNDLLPASPSGLSDQQAVFVAAYVVDLDPQAAAAEAGYDPTHGTTLLKNPYVRAAVDKAISQRVVSAGITVERVLSELAKIGFADIGSVLEWGEREAELTDGIVDIDEAGAPVTGKIRKVYPFVHLKSTSEIPPEARAAISEISETKDGIKVKFHGKIEALLNMGKYLKMFVERHEHSGPGGTPIPMAHGRLDMDMYKQATKELLTNV